MISWTLSVLVVAAIGGGLLHALRGFVPVLGIFPMQIHVGAALAAAVLLAAHVLPHRHRRWPLARRVDLDRRTALRAATVAAGGLALWAVAPGRERRFTGSHEVSAAAMPVTQWLFDPVSHWTRPAGGCGCRGRRWISTRWPPSRRRPSAR